MKITEGKYSIEQNPKEHILYVRLQGIMHVARQIRKGVIARSKKEKADFKTKAYGQLIRYKEIHKELRDSFNFDIKSLEGMLALM